MNRKKTRKSKVFADYQDPQLLSVLQGGGVGILPTDTLYGLVGSALDQAAVERVYQLKSRDQDKPSIILIGDKSQLDLFGTSKGDQDKASSYWPGPVSIILPCPEAAFTYLHRAKKSLAFRLPNSQQLRQFLAASGPLVAPSANFQAAQPATTIARAQAYFGDRVDFYVDGGQLSGKPSKLISLLGPEPRILRK